MSSCTRFEREALAALETGEPLDRHFEECPDCLRAREEHRALLRALENADTSQPAEGWQEQVRARIQRAAREAKPERPPRRRMVWRLSAIAASIAVAAIAVSLWSTGDDQLRVALSTVAEAQRATKAKPGQVLSTGAELNTGDTISITGPAQIRVYRHDRELLYTAERRGVFPLPSPGRYRVVSMSGDKLPAGGGHLDEDSAKVLKLGGRVDLGPELKVR